MENPEATPTDPELAEKIETRITELCVQFPKGVPEKVLQNDMPEINSKDRAAVINRLLVAGKLDLYKQGNNLVYKLKNVAVSDKIKDADNEEKIIYKIIADVGNKGIWTRDIRLKSNLLLTQVNKILKLLEGKKLIKAVKSVSASKKKVYMLYDLEPDRSITGGAWYSDQDFEIEFVDILNQQCYKFLEQKAEMAASHKGGPKLEKAMSCASSKEVWTYIEKLGISKVQLSVDDIETILDTLVYDGKVDKVAEAGVGSHSADDNAHVYRISKPLIDTPGLVCIPCGLCPVSKHCSSIGHITQRKCVYLKEWLDI